MNFAKYLSVIAVSMLKFAGGPLTGLAIKLSWIETAICSVVGMMLTVSLIVFSGDFIRKIFRKDKPKKFTKMTRFGVKIRRKFGLIGIAFLTPILFTPPVGAALSIAFRYDKKEILIQMLISAVAWAIAQTLFFYFVKDLIFK
ncbi:hypothetical protein GCM10011514_45260 [Emticicia aquatilis]|uniref:Small multi-drug export protein n=1 Tax=Emticicia aquatilis TaxID=1537369 RepID=A0A916Z6A8_9BACT|nr:hypothetical protein [Emticicia aquatilis]GGD76206.1 hypothetical protein GCM10011514_45260 [Emticicia aquatilis]